MAQERPQSEGETERKAAGITPGPEPQDGAGLPVPPDLSGHLHDQESPPGCRPLESLAGKRQEQRPAAYRQGRLHHHEPLGRRAPLVREPDQQRHSRRLQQPHPIRQGESSGLSHPQELHQHGLPDPGETGSQATHLKRRGTKTLHKVGGYEFCDLDYRQICLWGEQFGMAPDGIVKMLADMGPAEEHHSWLKDDYDAYRFTVEDGHITRLFWYFSDAPKSSFQILDELLIEKILLYGNGKVDLFHGESVNLRLPTLKSLALIDCNITFLDLSGVPQLTELRCGNNQLTELDLSGVPQLISLWCESNKLNELDLSDVPQLISLWCRINQLTELDLPGVQQLNLLFCGNNELTELDLSGVPQLTWLECGENQLTELDLSGVPQLTRLGCRKNELTELDLSGVPQLTELYCGENQLIELDLTRVPQLTELSCGGNQLTDLDLTPLPYLEVVNCVSNSITELDIRPLTRLRKLDVDDNVRIIGKCP
uniref:Leucine-rich repeat domain-containing protein n=1 Tax=mine drainage metagenome TaxID=410659 RepID=E6QNX1_9ZZZZ